MAAELVNRLAILVAVCRFSRMGVAKSRSLRYDCYARMQHFVRRSTCVPFRDFWGTCGENPCKVFLLLFMVLWVPIFATLCMRAMFIP
jgi:hypothetical protein